MGDCRTMGTFSMIEKLDIIVLPEDLLRGQREFPPRVLRNLGADGAKNGENGGEEEVDNEEEDKTPTLKYCK